MNTSPFNKNIILQKDESLKSHEELLSDLIKSAELSLEHIKNEEQNHLSVHLRADISDFPDEFIASELHYLDQLMSAFKNNNEYLKLYDNHQQQETSNNLINLRNKHMSIINQTNKSILSLHNKITQLISTRITEVKGKINKGELSPSEEIDSYPKMIDHLNLMLTKLNNSKISTPEVWEIFNNFVIGWTQYINDEYDFVHNHIKQEEILQIEKIKSLLSEIRNRIGTTYNEDEVF